MSKEGCYKCQFRTIGCHATCLVYKEYKERLAQIKSNREAYIKSFPLSKVKYYISR